jgi:hypothetical protein
VKKENLPAIAAVATVSAIASAPATPATSASVAAAMPAASAAVTSTPAAASAATAFSLGASFVDDKVPAAEILAVEGVDGAVGVFVVGNLDEGETARLPGKTIANEIDTRGSNTDLSKPLLHLFFRRGKRKITDVKLLHLPTPSARNPRESRGAR